MSASLYDQWNSGDVSDYSKDSNCAISFRLLVSSPRTFPNLLFITAMVAGIIVPRLRLYYCHTTLIEGQLFTIKRH